MYAVFFYLLLDAVKYIKSDDLKCSVLCDLYA